LVSVVRTDREPSARVVSSVRSGKDNLSTRDIVRRLVDSGQPERTGSGSGARAAAAACEKLYRGLSRWVGPDGSHALFNRALAEARTESAALDQIRFRHDKNTYVEGLEETIEARGDAATAEALESVLVHLVELLGRMIGDDMATTLIDRSIASTAGSDASSNDRQEEA